MIPEGPESWPLPRSFIQIFPLWELLGKLTLPQIFYTHFSLSFPQIFPLLNFSLFPSLTSFKPNSNLIYSLKLSFTSPGKVCSSVRALLAPENPVMYPLDILGDSWFHLFPPNPKGPPLALTSHFTETQIWFQPVMKSLQRRDWR